HHGQEEQAGTRGNVRDIGYPELVRSSRGEVPIHQIRAGRAPLSGVVVRHFFQRVAPLSPPTRISRPTRLWLTIRPLSRSSAYMRGRPYDSRLSLWICSISPSSSSFAIERIEGGRLSQA